MVHEYVRDGISEADVYMCEMAHHTSSERHCTFAKTTKSVLLYKNIILWALFLIKRLQVFLFNDVGRALLKFFSIWKKLTFSLFICWIVICFGQIVVIVMSLFRQSSIYYLPLNIYFDLWLSKFSWLQLILHANGDCLNYLSLWRIFLNLINYLLALIILHLKSGQIMDLALEGSRIFTVSKIKEPFQELK